MQGTARTTIATLAVVVALGLAACGGSSSLPTPPPATVAPPASSAPLPSVVDPTPVGGVDPTPVGGVPEGPAVVVTALNIAFEPQAVTVPANVPLTLVLDNRDTGIPHDIAVSDANGNVIVKSEIINGPAQTQVAVPALAPGVYPFICVVHPNMTGMITAE